MSSKIEYRDCTPFVQVCAKLGYLSYTSNSGGLAWDGRPCPTWDQLLAQGSPVVSHWCAAAIEIVSQVGAGIGKMLYEAGCVPDAIGVMPDRPAPTRIPGPGTTGAERSGR